MIRLEHALLVALAAVLPLFESPKNLFWLLYLIVWLANRVRARDFGGPWDLWDTLIVTYLASVAAAIAFGALGAEWRALLDHVKFMSVLWVMKRSRYPERVLVAVVVALAAGTVAALALGYYFILVTQSRFHLGLHPVGHVNHSAIYLAIAFAAALMATRAWWRSATSAWRIASILCTLLFAVSLFVMQSRAAVGAGIVVAAVLLLTYAARHRANLRPLALGAAILIGLGIASKPEVLEKNYIQIEKSGTLFAFRENIWEAGLMASREFPLRGVGLDSWGKITDERLEDWLEKRGEKLAPDPRRWAPHGHSLYLNTLVERGAFGLAVMVGLLAVWLVALLQRMPDAGTSPLLWTYWGGAAGAWLIATIVGIVNTTFHHEHAMISVMLLGGWLAQRSAITAATDAAGGRDPRAPQRPLKAPGTRVPSA
jgi:O-antigen ligase